MSQSQLITQDNANQSQNITFATAQNAPVLEARRDLPRELQNARVSNTPRVSTGFSIREGEPRVTGARVSQKLITSLREKE